MLCVLVCDKEGEKTADIVLHSKVNSRKFQEVGQ